MLIKHIIMNILWNVMQRVIKIGYLIQYVEANFPFSFWYFWNCTSKKRFLIIPHKEYIDYFVNFIIQFVKECAAQVLRKPSETFSH